MDELRSVSALKTLLNAPRSPASARREKRTDIRMLLYAPSDVASDADHCEKGENGGDVVVVVVASDPESISH